MLASFRLIFHHIWPSSCLGQLLSDILPPLNSPKQSAESMLSPLASTLCRLLSWGSQQWSNIYMQTTQLLTLVLALSTHLWFTTCPPPHPYPLSLYVAFYQREQIVGFVHLLKLQLHRWVAFVCMFVHAFAQWLPPFVFSASCVCLGNRLV